MDTERRPHLVCCVLALLAVYGVPTRSTSGPGQAHTLASRSAPSTEIIEDALALFDGNYVDPPDWIGFFFAALEGLTNAETMFDVVVTEGPTVRLVHRGSAESALTFVLSRDASINDVRRELLRAVDFVRQSGGLSADAVASYLIDGLNARWGPKSRPAAPVPSALTADEVTSADLGDGLCYVRIAQFEDRTPDTVSKTLKTRGVAGAVLDLRGCSGGPIQPAIDTAGLFLPNRTTVIIAKGRRVPEIRLSGRKGHGLERLPVVVLVDGDTAGGAEIVAGALHDTRGAPLVGEKTKGNASIVAVFRLPNQQRLVVPTSRWFTPTGTSIDGTGFLPSIPTARNTDATCSLENDPQVTAAVDSLRRTIATKTR